MPFVGSVKRKTLGVILEGLIPPCRRPPYRAWSSTRRRLTPVFNSSDIAPPLVRHTLLLRWLFNLKRPSSSRAAALGHHSSPRSSRLRRARLTPALAYPSSSIRRARA